MNCCSLSPVTHRGNIQRSDRREIQQKFLARFVIIVLILWLPAMVVRGQAIYRTPQGQKYHLGSCRSVKNVAQKITLDEAQKAGLSPCKICQPPVSQTAQTLVNKAAGQSPETKQCVGFTKAGARCKHRTSIANGYCYQHQP